ncbi:hypothetical protein A2467_02330 [Candidatus Nomurabacteria bacterium RIFOXYC2_FULL_36_8]|nr:MAG: hypothetical protein US08_C0002G0086 [Candidatus Nomurabacteria bacterium GW2011_GWF2_36_19]KKQ05910.1 MAG: hypothetical protein US17_C0001G0088 [Candidatus Nomurabacteria bacterium GW2011_GWF1_36_47]OGJ05428.1 MAG: hypothetical protein A2387_02480 [Candidatus Nomurabacteria bacterium RIFOXYB1_FULL_36_10]OGJ10951.1 MAG: hypothetical protein A2467_02330 [Candidatus Nomurabacteria bacterium RIFOXYC2_FULL_36_8]OGJ11311.1 MAG: hypothetical protein A2565_01735 [Candidatus Nomurabacteria bact
MKKHMQTIANDDKTEDDAIAEDASKKNESILVDSVTEKANGIPSFYQNNSQRGVLTKREIKEKNLILFDNLRDINEDCYSNASYDFRIGEKFAVPKDNGSCIFNMSYQQLSCPHYKLDEPQIQSCRSYNNVVRIPAHSSIIFSTFEQVKLPGNIVGRFDLRIKWALQGLEFQAGTQIEPYYTGRLFGHIKNTTNREILIPFKERLLTVEFTYTSEMADIPIEKNKNEKFNTNTIEGYLSEYSVMEGSLSYLFTKIERAENDFRSKMEDTRDKINEGYAQILEANRFRNTIRMAVFMGVLTIILSVGLTFAVSKYTMEKDDYPFQKVYDLEQTLKALQVQQNKILGLKLELDSLKSVKQERNNEKK